MQRLRLLGPVDVLVGSLRSYIHGLRRVLGADAVTGRGQPGYSLALPADALDIEQFLTAVRVGERR